MSLPNAHFADAANEITYRNGARPMHDYLLLNAKEAPDQAAYIFYGREVPWRELADSTRRLAGFLREKGIGKGGGKKGRSNFSKDGSDSGSSWSPYGPGKGKGNGY